MPWQIISEQDRERYNAVVHHPLQSYEWGEFREATGVKVIRKGFFDKNTLTSGFQITIHKIPHTNYTIGYLQKGTYQPKKSLLNWKKLVAITIVYIFSLNQIF